MDVELPCLIDGGILLEFSCLYDFMSFRMYVYIYIYYTYIIYDHICTESMNAPFAIAIHSCVIDVGIS